MELVKTKKPKINLSSETLSAVWHGHNKTFVRQLPPAQNLFYLSDKNFFPKDQDHNVICWM